MKLASSWVRSVCKFAAVTEFNDFINNLKQLGFSRWEGKGCVMLRKELAEGYLLVGTHDCQLPSAVKPITAVLRTKDRKESQTFSSLPEALEGIRMLLGPIQTADMSEEEIQARLYDLKGWDADQEEVRNLLRQYRALPGKDPEARPEFMR